MYVSIYKIHLNPKNSKRDPITAKRGRSRMQRSERTTMDVPEPYEGAHVLYFSWGKILWSSNQSET